MDGLKTPPLLVYNTGMSFAEIKNAICEKAQLADLIGQSVNLKKTGGRYLGLCPFHEEKTPSFTVFDDRYFCFGCKASGDVIDFVRKINGSNFLEAVHFLGAKYGIDTDSLKKNKKKTAPRQAMHEALLKARDFFHHNLKTAAGQQALAYLRQRGVSEAEIVHSKIGYALPVPFALKEQLRKHGVALATAVDASLLSDKGNKGDFFRNRIMFPIHDARGQVVGFGGRTLDRNSRIKYLNSRENELFHKAKVLFGLWHAAQEIAAQKTAIVVEGYFDWLALQRAGIKHCVACMGTALTVAQMRLLQRHIDKVILLFDGDRAGIEAARHALPLTFDFPQINIKAAQLTSGHDPDSLLKEQGTEALQQLLDKSEDVVEFGIIGKLRDQDVRNYPNVLRDEILPLLREIKDDMQRGTLIAQIAEYSGIPRDTIAQGLRKTRTKQAPAARSTPKAASVSMWLMEFVGHLYYAEPQTLDIEKLQEFVQQELALDPDWQALLAVMLDNLQQGTLNCKVDALPEDEFAAVIKETLAEARKNPALYSTDHAHALAILMQIHKRKKLKEKIALLQKDLHRADEPRKRTLLPTIFALQQERRELGRMDMSSPAQRT